MSNAELMEKLTFAATNLFGGKIDYQVAAVVKLAVRALAEAEWSPIETAPLRKEIVVGWWDAGPTGDDPDAGWGDIDLVHLEVSRAAWRPGNRAWLSHTTSNYGIPGQPHQWPTHWRWPGKPQQNAGVS